MIDIRYRILGDLLADIEPLERQYPQKVYRAIARDALPPLSRALSRNVMRYPPERDRSRKFVWSLDPAANARARRWFFANYPNGYTRTNKLAEAWSVDIYFFRGEIIIELLNDLRGASYVHGSDRYGQVPGHVTTGWRHVDTIRGEYAELADNAVREVYDSFLTKALGE